MSNYTRRKILTGIAGSTIVLAGCTSEPGDLPKNNTTHSNNTTTDTTVDDSMNNSELQIDSIESGTPDLTSTDVDIPERVTRDVVFVEVPQKNAVVVIAGVTLPNPCHEAVVSVAPDSGEITDEAINVNITVEDTSDSGVACASVIKQTTVTRTINFSDLKAGQVIVVSVPNSDNVKYTTTGEETSSTV